MKRRIGFLILALATAGGIATAGDSDAHGWKDPAGQDQRLFVTVTGEVAKQLHGQLSGFPETREFEDGLLPAVYITRKSPQLSCTESTIIGPGGDWSCTCRFTVGPDGSFLAERAGDAVASLPSRQ